MSCIGFTCEMSGKQCSLNLLSSKFILHTQINPTVIRCSEIHDCHILEILTLDGGSLLQKGKEVF